MPSRAEPDPSDLPKQNTIDIITRFNKHDILTPIEKYCSEDYVFECTQSDGTILKLDRIQMQNLREWYFKEYTPHAYGEIRSVAVSLERETATVWATILMHNDNSAGQAREKISIFNWRLEGMENGEKKWVWCKEFTSSGVVSPDQTSEVP